MTNTRATAPAAGNGGNPFTAEELTAIAKAIAEAVAPLEAQVEGLVARVAELEGRPALAPWGNAAELVARVAEVDRRLAGAENRAEMHHSVLGWLIGPDGWLRQYYRNHFESAQPPPPPAPIPIAPPPPSPPATLPALAGFS
jgi:hypothetical protein